MSAFIPEPLDPGPELFVADRVSPSSTSARTDSLAMARATSANRLVWSTPWRLSSRTRRPSLYATMRQPSTFSS
jgi:hypothetical protein